MVSSEAGEVAYPRTLQFRSWRSFLEKLRHVRKETHTTFIQALFVVETKYPSLGDWMKK